MVAKSFAGACALVVWVLSTIAAFALPPTTGILARTLMVKRGDARGTIFSIDIDQREYWVTAKHFITGAARPPYGSVTDKSVTVQLLKAGSVKEDWMTVDFKVLDPGVDLDILVLAAANAILQNPILPGPTPAVGATIGDDCEFLGFPHGGASRVTVGNVRGWLAFAKHCTISAVISESGTWVLDGINNDGFSGGPVLIGSGREQKILAVVSGYMPEQSDVLPRNTPKDSESHPSPEIVNLNSGLIFATAIEPAVEAIRKNPIGPVRRSELKRSHEP